MRDQGLYVFLLNAVLCFSLVTAYLFGSAIPRYNRTIVQSGIIFSNHFPIPSVALLYDMEIMQLVPLSTVELQCSREALLNEDLVDCGKCFERTADQVADGVFFFDPSKLGAAPFFTNVNGNLVNMFMPFHCKWVFISFALQNSSQREFLCNFCFRGCFQSAINNGAISRFALMI